MLTDYPIPEPFQFNPLKHHFKFIRIYILSNIDNEKGIDIKGLIKEIRHIGTSVMDVYTGSLTVDDICKEINGCLKKESADDYKKFSEWAGTKFSDFRTVTLSDSSRWMLKFHNDEKRYVHIFPARSSPHSFRVKANTLKSALAYYILIGKDFITRDDLNSARKHISLSPVKTTSDAEAITIMIEKLRSG
jgi:hypothetical protein